MPCECLGHKIPVPAKSNPKEWAKLRTFLNETQQKAAEEQAERKSIRRHHLTQQISKLQALPVNPGRSIEIKKLMAELVGLNA